MTDKDEDDDTDDDNDDDDIQSVLLTSLKKNQFGLYLMPQ